MRVAIDARWIFEEISGIGAYTRELIDALATLATDHTFVLYFTSEAIRDRTLSELRGADPARMEPRIQPRGVFSPLSQVVMGRALKKDAIDVYHSTNYMIPFAAFPRERMGAVSAVVTIHDVIPLKFPHFAPHSRKNRLFALYRGLMKEVVRRADTIITDSDASRRDVIAYCGIPAARTDRVQTIPCGVSARFCPPSAPTRHDASRERRILYVGRADPYKNVTGLIEAFAAARAAGLPPTHLLIAGSPDPRYPEAGQVADRLGLGEAVRWSGYLSENELVEAYQQSDLLVLPSRYEGFGLPVVEAMSCGVPVICSDQGSLPEVAGDAAIMIHPDDTPALGRAIVDVLTDDATWHRMSEAGLKHASGYTWKKTAQQTLAVYEELAQRSP